MQTGVGAEASTGGRRRRAVFALAALLAAGSIVAIVIATRSSPSSSPGNRIGAAGAAVVQRRDLVETDTESGTAGYADSQTVYDRLSGTITWLPGVGRVIEPGQVLYGVDGRPVVLFDGALPAYRTLRANDSPGPDILQLNRDLVRMGFADGEITVDDAWQTGTTDAVKRWQASIGVKQTGKIGLGWIVFLPAPQRVTQLETTCGSTGGGSGGSSGLGGSVQTSGCGVSEPTATAPAAHTEFVDSTVSTTTATTTAAAPTTTATPMTTTSTSTSSTTTATRTDGSGHGSGGGKSSAGARNANGAAGATAILHTTSTKLVVTVDLSASNQSEARVGERVTVELPAGTTVNGRVTAVSSVAQGSGAGGSANGAGQASGGSGGAGGAGGGGASGSGSSGSTIPVTVALSGHHSGAGLDQAAVSVVFARARARNVLSVPVTALLATAGGGYALQTASPPHELIPVATGLFAAGFVEVSGPGVYAGLLVTDSQG